jgi:glycine/D-amino acid oxidase-like deaminating enzyme
MQTVYQQTLVTDIAIIGGGIAGLYTAWALQKHLPQYRFVLLENTALGAGQTIQSQGIIHGGLKYAFSGQLSQESEVLAKMPGYWQERLARDFTTTRILAREQCLLAPTGLLGKLGSFFASKMLRGRVERIAEQAWPEFWRQAGFVGQVYRLEELVLDVGSLVTNLAQLLLPNLVKVQQVKMENNGRWSYQLADGSWQELVAQQYWCLAGQGNASLLADAGLPLLPLQQERPLHMVYVEDPQLLPVYAHWLGNGMQPRLTITSHQGRQAGSWLWYLGGCLAEEGVLRDEAAQLAAAKRELQALFPQLRLSAAARWGCQRAVRAEAATTGRAKPVGVSIQCLSATVLAAWPTKLALAPLLAEQLLAYLQRAGFTPGALGASAVCVASLPKPNVAEYTWA